MDMDRFANPLDTPMLVHRRHGLMQQVVRVRGQNVKPQDFAGTGIHHSLQPSTGLTDRLGPERMNALPADGWVP